MSGFQVYACGMAGVVFGALAGIAVTPSPNAGQDVAVATEIREFSSSSIQIGAAAGIFAWQNYLFVPDIMEKRVLRIDRNTGNMAHVGRPGPGPGEFRRPRTVGVLKDTLWVLDSADGSISFFDASGSHARTLALATPVLAATPLPDGSVLYVPVSTVPSLSGIPGPERNVVIRRRFAGGGSVDDTVLTTLDERPIVRFQVGNLTRVISRPLPFQSHSGIMPDGNGLIVVEQLPDTGAIVVHEVTGRGARARLELQVRTTAVTARDAGSVATEIAEGVRQSLSRMQLDPDAYRVRQSTIEDVLHLPRSYPPVSGVTVDAEGHVWLRREQVADSPSLVWEQYDSRGTRTAAVAVPKACEHVAFDRVQGFTCAHYDNEVGWSIRLFRW